ncbi:hypothetical protein [Sphingobium abikonense]|uniref:hypothetical protein n=1 Tax=Sphingobium abikonense TaxID=86193 RepID=UPI000A484DDC|nr:hypothetical protein [Sphingobium abikonense]
MLKKTSQVLAIASSVKNLWPIVISFVGGTFTGWVGSWSEALKPYGLVAWVGIGLLAAFLISVIIFAGALAWETIASAKATIKWSKDAEDINPLSEYFENRRIKLLDIAHPVSNLIRNKRFYSCELVGPANLILLLDNTIVRNNFHNCDFVLLNTHKNIPAYAATGLQNCDIRSCEIFKCTIYVDSNTLNYLRQGSPDLQVLSYEPGQ